MSNASYAAPQTNAAPDVPRLLYAAQAQYEKDWHSTMHVHACAEIFYCTHGIGEMRLENERVTVGSDDLIVVNPNVEHTETSLAANPLEYIALGVDGLAFRFADTDKPYRVVNCRDDNARYLFFMQALLEECVSHAAGCEQMSEHLMAGFLILLLRNGQLAAQIATLRRGNKECADARRYLDEHYAETVTLDALADYTHLNKYYLVHAFSKEYGITPINYLIDRRIRESKFLLSGTSLSLARISHELGFSSPSYFSQSFRRLTGMTPLEYRKRNKSE